MSILDPVRKTMPVIWDENRQLRPEVKAQILDIIYKYIPPENIRQMFIIGTITGFQYTDDSDVDIQVVVDPPELAEHGPNTLVRKIQEEVNGVLVEGTKHPINFFLYKYLGKPAEWQDASFGVYNLLEDKWEADPGNPEDIRDPEEEYATELTTAKSYVNKFEFLVNRWKQNLKKLELFKTDELQRDYIKKELKRDFTELLEFCHDIDRDRKTEYDLGFGIPRKNWRNIVFKILSSGPNKEVFEFFKELKVDDYYTHMYNVIKQAIADYSSIIYQTPDPYNIKDRLNQ